MVRNSNSPADIIRVQQAIFQHHLTALDQQLDAMLAGHPLAVGIDLSSVEAFDSAALAWLIQVQARLLREGVDLHLYDPSPTAVDVLAATRLDQRFKIMNSALRRNEVNLG